MSDEILVARCGCGWESRGTEEQVVAATQDHAGRVHNMVARREDILAQVERLAPATEA
jgi:predicted small metal-binding protein